MTAVDDIARAVGELRHQPHGPARIAAAERLVARATETGDRPVLIAALQEQISAYNHGGESERMLVPFARVLKMWDERPEDFDGYGRHTLFWQFKWASTGMIWHPDVPLSTVRHWLDEMERRYRVAGFGLQPVYSQRHHLAVHLGDEEDAARYFEEWTAADRTEMSDCHACELGAQGDWHESVGDDAEALRSWAPVLRGERTCIEEPHIVLAKSLLPLVRLGRVDEARANHLRGYRMVRGNPNLLRAIGQHIEFAALTGNEARGMEMLAEHARRLAQATDDTANLLGLLEGAAVLLRRLRDLGQDALEVPVLAHRAGPPGSTTTVADLLRGVEAEIAEIGERFDRRNGVTAVSDRSRKRMATQPLLASLPLGVRTSTVIVAPPPSTMDIATAVSGGRRSLDALIAEATRLAEARDPRAVRAWERVAATGRELPPPIEARIAESRAVEAARTDAPDAVERFLDVAERFAAAGEPDRALANRARAGLAAAMDDRAAPVSADPFAALAELDALRAAGEPVEDRLVWTVRFCAVRTRMARWMAAGGSAADDAHAGLDRELAEMIADAERAGDGYELADALVNRAQVGLVAGAAEPAPEQLDRAVEAYLGVGALAPAASAMLIRAQVALGADDPVEAEAHLLRARRTGGDLLEERSRAQIAALLAEVHLRRGGEDGAAAAEALTAAHLFDGFDPDSAIRARRRAALAFERDGRPAEAAALLESVLPDLDKLGDPEEIAPVRHEYGRCLNALGEHREAARMFISAATLVRDWPDQVPHASLTHEAGDALEAAGLHRDAEAAYRRASDLWRAAGKPDAAVRASRAVAWTLVQREDPDWAGALALFEEAATASDAERAETLFQAAQLVLDWPADTRPVDLAGRALAMADEAAAGLRGSGDLERATRADILAAEALGGPLADPDAAVARVAAARQRAADAGAKHLVEWCDDVARHWER